MKELASIENKISRLNVFCRVRAGLFGLCFHLYTWLSNIGKKTKREPPSKKAKQEEKQTGVKSNHCCLNGQNKNKRPPEENDDDESYNSRGTLFR